METPDGSDNSTSRRMLLASGGLAAIAAMVAVAPRAEAAANTDQEKDAIKVVHDFFGAYATGDPSQIGQYVADKLEFRVNPETECQAGRDAFEDRVGKYIKGQVGKGLIFSAHPVTESFAVSVPAGIAVLTKRVWKYRAADHEPAAHAAISLVVGGKIAAWYDF